MSRQIIRIIPVIALLSLLLVPTGCSKMNISAGKGFLSGVVSIGPLCPVERFPPDSSCLPTAETFKAYPVGIWSADGKRKVAAISPALNGSYLAGICAGTYLVKLELEQPGPGDSSLPLEVTITEGDTTTLDINIDTGIR